MTTQVAALDANAISAFHTSQLHGLSLDSVAALSTAAIHALSTQQLVSLSTIQVTAFSPDDIAALSTAQAHALTPGQIGALSTTQVVAFATADLAAMTLAQVNAFTADDFAALSTAQFAALISVTPIVLDLSGLGIHTLSAAQGVSFDLTATGHAQQTGWVGAGNALLVRDLNGDGVINDGRELFGSATVLPNGQRAGNGYAAMAALDSQHDGVLNAQDAAWNQLKVWVDTNHDGQTDPGELKTLAEAGVVAINLNFSQGTALDHGNLLGMVSSYRASDGAQHAVADVSFLQQPATAPAVSPALTDLLVPPAASLPGLGPPASDAGATIAPAHPAVVPLHAARWASDEDWRHGTALL
jgi:hypothetical protein